jgi:hypothetical protein
MHEPSVCPERASIRRRHADITRAHRHIGRALCIPSSYHRMVEAAWTRYMAVSRPSDARRRTVIIGRNLLFGGCHHQEDALVKTPVSKLRDASNQTMERTPDRCAFTFQMTSILQLRAKRALVRRR